mgnify:CR=1 FL=1
METAEKKQVLIVGAGPVGLALALELGIRGIPTLVVERRDGSVKIPKMSMVSTRNMEFCRRWGIADEVRNAVWDQDRELDFVYVERLAGRELARMPVPSYRTRMLTAPSPEVSCHCPQLYFDPILQRRVAREPSVALAYETVLEDFSQDSEGVTATLSDASGQRTVRCEYLVGCDGAGSQVRAKLDISMQGLGTVARSVNIFFSSPDLVTRHKHGWARIYRFIDASGCWSELIPIDGKDLWRLTVFDDALAAKDGEQSLQRMFGGSFPFSILDVSAWDRRDFVAVAYERGRVFLAGDSAHQCSPTGGLGMATGIEEAVNLGWKLAAMLQGWGGQHLIDTYEFERRPRAVYNVALSTRAFQTIASIPPCPHGLDASQLDLESWRKDLSIYSIPDHLKFQYTYTDSRICVPDGSSPPPSEPTTFVASAAPGSRAPHCWLGENQSILDLFSESFTLLRFSPDAVCDDLLEALKAAGVPVCTRLVLNETAALLYGAPMALIRPDGHVAWRGSRPGDAAGIAARVRGA